ncbi:hypothetical protein ACFL2J_07700 [Candidatus Omnitrophota bacterium]
MKNSKLTSNRDRLGLTLVEIVVAIGILTMASTSLFFMLLKNLSFTNETIQRKTALNLAQQELERLRSLKYTRLGVGAPTSEPPGVGFMDVDGDGYDALEAFFYEDLPASILTGATRRVLIEAVDDVYDGLGGSDIDGLSDPSSGSVLDYKKVTIQINWTRKNGNEEQLDLVSYVYGDVYADEVPDGASMGPGGGMAMDGGMGMGGMGMGDTDLGPAMGMGEDPPDEDPND